jgi:hypothetical protein
MGTIYRKRSSFSRIEELAFRITVLEKLIENHLEKK